MGYVVLLKFLRAKHLIEKVHERLFEMQRWRIGGTTTTRLTGFVEEIEKCKQFLIMAGEAVNLRR
jgi:hypothetical protein